MATLAEIRQQYPQYSDLDDGALAERLHQRFYSDIPRQEFDQRVGFSPENARDSELRRQANEQLTREREENPALDALRAPGGAENAIRGIPIVGGLVDEARAGVGAAANWATGGRVGQPYDEGLAYERARHRRYDEENPVASTVTRLAGGLAAAPVTPVIQGVTTLGRIAGGAATGAGYGAAHGFAEGEGGFGNRMATAGEYGALGAGVGAALPAAMTVAGWGNNAMRQAVPWVAARLPGRDAGRIADDILASRIDRSGQSLTDVRRDLAAGQEAARFDSNSRAQLPEMIADTSDSMQRLTGSVYRQGGRAGEIVRDALETRQRGNPNQISRFASGDTGQRGQIDDALSRALRLSTSESARSTERRIAADQAREGRRLYDEAYRQSEPFEIRTPMNEFGYVRQQYSGPFRAALDRAAALFEAPMGAMTRGFGRMDIRRFDAAKKQLDDMIEGARRAGENNLARELTVFKNNLLEQVHGADGARNAAYRTAREAWESAAENREAVELGRAALRESSEVSVEQFRQLTPSQQTFFRQGFLESARNALGSRRPGNDATMPFQNARVQDLLREIIPNSSPRARSAATAGVFGDRSGRFGEYMRRQERMGSTRNRVLGNSATAQRHQDDAQFAADALSRVMMGPRGWTSAGLEVVGAALMRATAFRQDVAESLAQRLVEADPQAQLRILAALRQRMGPDRFGEFVSHINRSVPAASSSVGDAAIEPSGNAMRGM